MGPIALFDKSFVEMLNVDEAAIFDALYSSVICPIFFAEVLADLSKEPPGQRTAERIVADVAKKTPIMHSTPTTSHATLCLGELLGHPVEMREVPVRSGGRVVRRADGSTGVYYGEAPEAEAFSRWQKGQFREIERDHAAAWRRQVVDTDHALMAQLARDVLRITTHPRNLKEALKIAQEVLQAKGQRFLSLKTAYALLGLDPRQFRRIQVRWADLGRPPIREFAPYTAYCLLVEIFFHVCVHKGLISPDRPSNRIDVAYLFYLPFTMVFASNDKLHQRVAPLFMNARQIFIFGADLKQDLSTLDAHYSALPDEQKIEGLFRLAGYPPDDEKFLTTRVWKQLGMRTVRPPKRASEDDGPLATELLATTKQMRKAAKRSPLGSLTRAEIVAAEHIVIERAIPLQRGKWKLLPPGVESSRDDDDDE